jgi:hypothetical protein
MQLAKTIGLMAVLLIVLLAAGHALSAEAVVPAASGQAEARHTKTERIRRCVIKPVMTDAEIELCRLASY